MKVRAVVVSLNPEPFVVCKRQDLHPLGSVCAQFDPQVSENNPADIASVMASKFDVPGAKLSTALPSIVVYQVLLYCCLSTAQRSTYVRRFVFCPDTNIQ